MKVVVDSNLCLACVLPLPYSAWASRRMHAWEVDQVELCAPALWGYEIVSVLRKWVARDLLDGSAAERILADLLALGIQEMQSTPRRHRLALAWAARLGQQVAYDGAYVALADDLGSEFWTADRRLAQNARSVGASWVRWIGENEPDSPA